MEGAGSLFTPASQHEGKPRGAGGFPPFLPPLGRPSQQELRSPKHPPGFPGGSVVKNLSPTRETWARPLVRLIPWRRAWHPLQHSRPGDPMDGGARWATGRGSQGAGQARAADSRPPRCPAPPQAAGSARLGRARRSSGRHARAIQHHEGKSRRPARE